MLQLYEQYKVYLLFSVALSCLFLALFILIIKFQEINKKKALFKIELFTAFMLFGDATAYIYGGDMRKIGIFMLRISVFGSFLFLRAIIYAFNEYLVAIFMRTGAFIKLPKRLLLGFILPSIDMTFVILSLLFKVYFYFDAGNVYHRAFLYPLCYVLPSVTLVLQLSFIIEHRKLISRGLAHSAMLFIAVPMMAASFQITHYGYSLINISTGFAAIILFVFVLFEQNNTLLNAANTDVQTKLPNAFGYIYEVDLIKERKDITQYDGYYFDIVRMGNYNNKYGKAIGDQIIYDYGHYIRKHLDKDEIIGRLGGNFYVALVKKSNREKFVSMLTSVPLTLKVNNQTVTEMVSAIAGGYHIDSKNITGSQLLGYMSMAINYAKNDAKKNLVFMDQSLEDSLNHARKIEEMSREALKKGEFIPYYQPKIDLVTKKLCGAEALVRWKRKGKLISPAEFVPIMEKNTSICDLDFYILDYVCKDMRKWLDEGITPPKVSVNFSRKNLGNPVFAEDVYKVVMGNNVPLDLIQIEITETIDEFPMSYLVGVVEALQRYGLSVAIDDFGTGSSSINLLKQVTFDVLKIDREFVDFKDEKEKKLLTHIIQMAQAIGVSVIAEGVEEVDQLLVLNSMGCTEIQGYIFDKPLEKQEFEYRMRNEDCYKEKINSFIK